MQRKWFYYNKAIPKRKCFFILDLRKSDGTLCKQDSGAGSSLWSLRSASWEHCSTLVQHILDWQHILMGTTTLPSFSALLVWFFSFSAHLSSATIAWRLLGKKSLTHRTRPWAHAGVTESHNLTNAIKKANHRGMALVVTTRIKHWPCKHVTKKVKFQDMTWFLQISLLQHVMTVFLPISCHFVCNYGIMVSFFSHWHLHIKNQNKLQTWRLGSTAKKCRTCINALHVIHCLSDIEVWSLALATLEQNRGLLPNFMINITTSTDSDSIVFCEALLHQSAVLDQLNQTKDVINLTKKNELTQTDKFW